MKAVRHCEIEFTELCEAPTTFLHTFAQQVQGSSLDIHVQHASKFAHTALQLPWSSLVRTLGNLAGLQVKGALDIHGCKLSHKVLENKGQRHPGDGVGCVACAANDMAPGVPYMQAAQSRWPLQAQGSMMTQICHFQVDCQGIICDCDRSQPEKASPEGLAMCAPRAAVSLGCMVGVRMDPQLWQASMTA